MDAADKDAADKKAAEAKAAADLQADAQKQALASAKALNAEEEKGDTAATKSAAAQLANDTERLTKLRQYADAAASETTTRYQDAQNRAEEAFQGFMDPDKFRATEDAKEKRISSEKELQNTVKWMGNKPRDWMTDKEKAATDVMSARDEAAAAAIVLGLIETNTRALDVKLDALIKMKG
jgi:colicin import membrane protein